MYKRIAIATLIDILAYAISFLIYSVAFLARTLELLEQSFVALQSSTVPFAQALSMQLQLQFVYLTLTVFFILFVANSIKLAALYTLNLKKNALVWVGKTIVFVALAYLSLQLLLLTTASFIPLDTVVQLFLFFLFATFAYSAIELHRWVSGKPIQLSYAHWLWYMVGAGLLTLISVQVSILALLLPVWHNVVLVYELRGISTASESVKKSSRRKSSTMKNS